MTELPEHALRDIERTLRDEVHTHALRTNEADHLLDFVNERLWRVLEKQMRFIKKEDELGPILVSYFLEFLEEFGKQPKQECRIKSLIREQLGRVEDIDVALAVAVG